MAKRILVIDPIPTHRIGVVAELKRAHYDVSSTVGAGDMVQLSGDLDLIVLGTSGMEPARVVGSLPVTKDIPILCLDNEAGPMRRLLALRAGAREMLPLRSAPELLLARLRLLIRESEANRELDRRSATAASFGIGMDEANARFEPARRIGCIGDDACGVAEIIAGITGYKTEALSWDQTLRETDKQTAPDAIIMSIGEGREDSLDQRLPELRDRNHSRHTPVMILYPSKASNIATRALNLGASEVAGAESCGEELALRLSGILERKELKDRLRRTNERSYRMAATDPLTGLFNRRYAETYLADVWERAQLSGRGFVVMMVDLDHFKQVNDTFGHDGGDQVLKVVAKRICDNLRAVDLVARMGGEEFLIVLPDTDGKEAEGAAERLRRLIADQSVSLDCGSKINVTASFGVTICEVEMTEHRRRTGTFDISEVTVAPMMRSILERADAALYRAKADGRNRVSISAADG